MKVASFVVAALLFSIAPTSAPAVDPSQQMKGYIRTHFTTEDGLPSGIINHITQTPDGFLWVTFNDSQVARFDGFRFTVFQSRFVIPVAAGPNGDIWLGA